MCAQGFENADKLLKAVEESINLLRKTHSGLVTVDVVELSLNLRMMLAEGKRQVGFLRKWDRRARKHGKEANLNGLRLPVHCSLATVLTDSCSCQSLDLHTVDLQHVFWIFLILPLSELIGRSPLRHSHPYDDFDSAQLRCI